MKDPETEYDFNAINEEEQTLSKVIETINTQITAAKEKHRIEEDKARELTSEIVSLRRAEEKVLLASDEAVAHAMRDSKRDQVTDLLKQLKKPYFARVKVEEEHIDAKGNESTKTFEYRIGYKTNLDSRIIDWRTAPIAKLYYEYKEGDEYSEVIQGVERLGTITLRNSQWRIKEVYYNKSVVFKNRHRLEKD